MSSAGEAVQVALVSALQANAPLMAEVTGVYDGPPPRAGFPYISISGGAASDWSTKTATGREFRLGLTLWDDGETPDRLHRLMGLIETIVPGMARDLPGWRVASIAFVRSFIARDPGRPWAGLTEFRVRVLAN